MRGPKFARHRRPAMVRFRRLAGASAALTFVLLLLGIYTAAAGAGLSCAQRWPLCDGAVFGLFPADWLSFVEWFHRLVAMVTGVVILATTVAAWRRGRDRQVRWALTLASALLPAQIALGALTVTRYDWAILTLHLSTAVVIFACVVAGTAWVYAPHRRARSRSALHVALGSLVVFAVPLLAPRTVLEPGAVDQTGYYAVGLVALAALLATWTWSAVDRVRGASGLAAVAVGVELVLGRQVYGTAVEVGLLVATAVALSLTLAAVRWAGAARPGDGALT